MKRIPALAIAALALAFALPAPAAAALAPSDSLPAWVKDVGARSTPTATRVFSANAYGAVADTLRSSTAAIQRAIDAAAAAGGGVVSFQPGGYVTGAIFLKTNVTLQVDEGVTLFGSQNDADYARRPTRIAGIEMTWPTALINVDGQKNVRITGKGTIDGRGKKWWDKYWSMRREVYEPRGLRWAVDYDAERVRLMVITNSSDISIENLNLRRSGFWTVQLLYSDHVTVDGVKIGDNEGPSTDGVDIDSSRWILVQNTEISNNDDTICLKAGRDADGLRVNRPTEYVVVRDNFATRGAGIFTIGSETSGSIRHVVAIHNRAKGTKNGIILKSAKTRGGIVEDVLIRDVVLDSVPTAFSFSLNWNPSYSYATLPDSIKTVPPHWRTLLTPVTPPERGYAEFRDITIEDVKVTGSRRLISAEGLPEKPIHDVHFRNVTARGADAGSIRYARDWTMDNVVFKTPSGEQVKVTDSRNVQLPGAEAVGGR